MPSLISVTRALNAVIVTLASASTLAAQVSKAPQTPDARLNTRDVAGLYQMIDPRGYADALTAATYLRLLPDGRSRLEGVIVSDVAGSISARAEIAQFHRLPWSIRRTAAGPELCFAVGSRLQCSQVERDPATDDLLLYDVARPRGHADLRLHRAVSSSTRVGSTNP